MFQKGLFEDPTLDRQVWSKNEMVVSVGSDQTKILRDIMKLHNGGQPFHCDVTYSKGVFYKTLPPPELKFDMTPQVDGVQQADARHLPLEDRTVRSIVFDPPFKASNSRVQGIIEKRFTAFPSMLHLWDFYEEALQEFMRVLVPSGLVVMKCQDGVSSGINHMSHTKVERSAEKVGFAHIDLFILLAKSIIWSQNMAKQKHARKAHSFFYVFRKPRYSDK